MSSTNAEDKIGPFILGPTLGEGATGKVKLAIHKDTGQKVAIKIITKTLLTSKPNLRRKVEREIAVMKLMNHPNVIRLYDVLQSRKYLFLIIEHVEGGELFDYIVQRGKLSLEEAFHFFRQIILGVEYCHKLLICHRDLKPENLLLDKNKNIKIADFGMANLMEGGKLMETSCGSPHYASPEVVKGEKYNGMEADVWSCGVILYALLTGTLPFDDDNLTVLLSKVKTGQYVMPSFLPEDVKDLISRMLCLDPGIRITLRDIKKHPWWKKMNAAFKDSQPDTPHTPTEKPDASIIPNVPATTTDILGEKKPSPVVPPLELAPKAPAKSPTTSPKIMTDEPQEMVFLSDLHETELPPLPEDEEQEVHHPTTVEDDNAEVEYGDEEEGKEEEELPPADVPPTPRKLKKSTLHKPLSIDEIDEDIFKSIVNMGWKDEQKLRESLTSKKTNIETVLYHLLEQRKQTQGSIKIESFHPSLSVNPSNPIKDNVDNMAILKQRLQEAAVAREERVKAEMSSSPKKASWFAFWKKKPAAPVKKQDDKQSTFGLHSMKTQQEIVNELARSFKVLAIHWTRLTESSIRAKFAENEAPVEFDISMTALPNDAGYLLNFARVAGDSGTARILFDVLQSELSL